MTKFSTTIDNAIIAYFYNSTALPTIWDKQDNNRPPLPYIALSIINDEDETGNQPDKTFNGTIATKTFRNLVTIRARIFSNTDDYMLKMRQAKHYQFNEISKKALNLAGMAVRGTGGITDIAMILDTSYELRASCDFEFAYTEQTTEADTQIIKISGTFNGEIIGAEQPTI